jgi:hypothetical protein
MTLSPLVQSICPPEFYLPTGIALSVDDTPVTFTFAGWSSRLPGPDRLGPGFPKPKSSHGLDSASKYYPDGTASFEACSPGVSCPYSA